MATIKITKKNVDSLISEAQAEGRTLYCWDESLSGFGVAATRTGKASYFIEYRIDGCKSSKRVTIGKHGPLTPDQGRKLAISKLGDVAKGRDVAQEKKDARLKLAADSFQDACDKWLALTRKENRAAKQDGRRLEMYAYPAIGKKPMTTIRRGDIASLIDDVAVHSQTVARQLFASIRPFFKWAVDRGIIEINPISEFKGPKPAAKRKRVLDPEEIRAFWTATAAMGWPFEPIYRLLG